jgi:hypothetical protein
MRKLINSIDISLDGVVEKHLWPRIERFGDEGRRDQIQTDLLLACDAVQPARRHQPGQRGARRELRAGVTWNSNMAVARTHRPDRARVAQEAAVLAEAQKLRDNA